MKKEIMVCEASVTIGELTLTPVVQCFISGVVVKGVFSFSASKQPLYVITNFRGQTKALDMLGQEVPVQKVKSEYSTEIFDQTVRSVLPDVSLNL